MTTRIECPECEGDGIIATSECCDSEVRNGHCMECGDRCRYSTCPTCKGAKVIEVNKEENDPRDTTDWSER